MIIHEVSRLRQENTKPLSPPHKLRIETHLNIEDEDEFSDEIEEKVGGIPTWLQDTIEYTNYIFALQFIASEFNDYWPTHKELFMDGICYLFLNKILDLSETQAGMFRIQYS